VRWRRRIGQDGVELLLQETIAAAQRSEAIKPQSLERVSVDTTVQPKAIAHPLDSGLYHRGREIPVRLAQRHGVPLRQSYARLGKKALRLASRSAHARQMKRARREIRRLKTYLGRVFRDVRRKLEDRPEVANVSQKRCPGSSDCWRSSGPTRTNSTPCTPRRWRASPRARRTGSTSSGPRSRWR
jgi:IS5 family transposase